MSKFEPKNRMEAYCYRFEDMVKLLMSQSLLNNKVEYIKQLDNIKQEIDICKELLDKEKS